MLRLLGVSRGRVEQQCNAKLAVAMLGCWLFWADRHARATRRAEGGRLAGCRADTPSELSPTDRIGIL